MIILLSDRDDHQGRVGFQSFGQRQQRLHYNQRNEEFEQQVNTSGAGIPDEKSIFNKISILFFDPNNLDIFSLILMEMES